MSPRMWLWRGLVTGWTAGIGYTLTLTSHLWGLGIVVLVVATILLVLYLALARSGEGTTE